MNQITTSLEVSKKLKDAGFEQKNATFYWCINKAGKDVLRYAGSHRGGSQADWIDPIAAWTAEEILRELPKKFSPWGKEGRLTVQYSKNSKVPLVGYIQHPSNDWLWRGENYQDGMLYFAEDTLANAAAMMKIYLKENNLLPSE